MILNYFPAYPVRLDAKRLGFAPSLSYPMGWRHMTVSGAFLRYHVATIDTQRVSCYEFSGLRLPVSLAYPILETSENIDDLLQRGRKERTNYLKAREAAC